MCAAFVTPVHAQDLLYFPLSARVVSMGSAGAADNATPSTIILNPANVIGPPRLYAQATEVTFDSFHDFWMRRANAGASLHVGSVLLGFDLAYFRLHLGQTFYTTPQKLTEDLVALALGAGFTSANNDFMIGASFKRYAEDEQEVSYPTLEMQTSKADAVAFDAGFEFRNRASLQGWDVNSALGAAILNTGSDYDHSGGTRQLPQRFRSGLNVRMVSPTVGVLGARVPLISFLANVDASKPRDEDWEWMAGTELAVAQMLFFRSGIHTFTGSENPDPSNASWGAGVGIPLRKLRARLDYGRESEFFGKIEHYELTLERTF